MATTCGHPTPTGPCQRPVAKARDCGVDHAKLAKTPKVPVTPGGARPPAPATQPAPTSISREAEATLHELDRHLKDLRGSFSNPGSGHAVGHRIASLAALNDPAVDAELAARFPHPSELSHPRWHVRIGVSADGGYPNRSQSSTTPSFAEAVRRANEPVNAPVYGELTGRSPGEARVAEVRPDYEGRTPIMHTNSYTSREGFGEDRVHDFRDPAPRPPTPPLKRLSYRERRAQIFGRAKG